MKLNTVKFLGILCILSGFVSPALGQITRVQARHVPMENMKEVIERETTYWAEVARQAIKEGHLSGWSLWRRIDGMNLDEEPNLFFVNSFTEEQFRGDARIWDFKKVFPDKELSEIETFSLGTVKGLLYYHNLVSINKSQPKFIRVNYAKPSNLGRYLELEQSVWQPFVQERMDSGKTNLVSWGLSRLILPRGQNIEWDAISIDGFDSLVDALMTDYGDDAVMPDVDELFDVHYKAQVHVYELIKGVGPED